MVFDCVLGKKYIYKRVTDTKEKVNYFHLFLFFDTRRNFPQWKIMEFGCMLEMSTQRERLD